MVCVSSKKIWISGKTLLTVLIIMVIGAADLSAKTIFVSTSGSSSGDGTSFEKGYNVSTALPKAVEGDTVLLQSGVHKVPYNASKANTITLSNGGSSGKLINVLAENSGRAVLDFSYPDNSRYLDPDKSIMAYGIYFNASASYWYFKNISITHAGYQGAYVCSGYMTFENCYFYDNWNSGLEVNKGGNNVTAKNCDSYKNFDFHYKNGGMSDGFAFKQTQGANNKLINCRAWENSDDGYDVFDSDQPVVFENCWAFRNGANVWNYSAFDGNGNGFKLGGLDKAQNNKVSNCISFGNLVKGFDQNNNTGSITLLNCIAYQDAINFGMGGSGSHTIKNCISLSSKGTIDVSAAKTQATNSWTSGFSVSASDFISLDTTLATKPRNADGSLPVTDLFRLKAGSKLIDAGTDVGLPFSGSKPDLGAFEKGTTRTGPVHEEKPFTGAKLMINGTLLKMSFVIPVNYASVTVYSMDGKKTLRSGPVKGTDVVLNCESLQAGSYISELRADGIKQQTKFFFARSER
jgi:hypothetical protein